MVYGVRPRPLSPEIDVRPVMQVSADIALVKEVRGGHAGLLRRPVGRAAAVADRDRSRSDMRTASRARTACATRAPSGSATAASPSRAPCAWTSPWPTSPIVPRSSTARRPSCSGTIPRLGPRGVGGHHLLGGPDQRRLPCPARLRARRPRRASSRVSVNRSPVRTSRAGPRDSASMVRMATSAKVKTVFGCQACGFESSQVARPLPGLRRVEQLRRGAAGGRRLRRKGRRQPRPEMGGQPKPYDLVDGAEADRASLRHRRVRPRAGRRDRPRLDGPHRRRARDRQEHAAPAGRAPARRARAAPCSTSPARSRSGRSSCAASGSGSPGGGLFLLAETSLERILEHVDDAQAGGAGRRLGADHLLRRSSRSAPGSISQVREVATQLLFLAKGRGITTFLIGHVTKDGNLAGPKSLEHIVDTVLYFEGEKQQHHRIVRAVKNRFGAISEMGVFEMTGDGPAGRCPTRPRCSCPSAWRARRARRWWPPWRARGPCSSRCRRWSRRPRSARRAACPSGLDANRTTPAPGRAREARGPRAARRRRLRERRRRARGGGAGGRPRRWPRPSRRPSATGPSPRAPPSSARSAWRARSAAPDRPRLRIREAAQMGFTRCILPARNLPRGPRDGIELVGVRTLEEALERLSSRADRRRPAPRGCIFGPSAHGLRFIHPSFEAVVIPSPRSAAREVPLCGSSCSASWCSSSSSPMPATSTRPFARSALGRGALGLLAALGIIALEHQAPVRPRPPPRRRAGRAAWSASSPRAWSGAPSTASTSIGRALRPRVARRVPRLHGPGHRRPQGRVVRARPHHRRLPGLRAARTSTRCSTPPSSSTGASPTSARPASSTAPWSCPQFVLRELQQVADSSDSPEAQPRPPRPRHPAEDPEDGRTSTCRSWRPTSRRSARWT